VREYIRLWSLQDEKDLSQQNWYAEDPGNNAAALGGLGIDSVKYYFAVPNKSRLLVALNTRTPGPYGFLLGTDVLAIWQQFFQYANKKSTLYCWDAHPGSRGPGYYR
jgi:hypothetical protein